MLGVRVEVLGCWVKGVAFLAANLQASNSVGLAARRRLQGFAKKALEAWAFVILLKVHFVEAHVLLTLYINIERVKGS